MLDAETAPEMIGQSPAFMHAIEHASNVAAVDRPALIVGERGAGKELFAARVHFLSNRWEGPLVKVNCAAMNEELLESELFGHEAGSFTGASKRHAGRFERAEGGTLFLDEISSASQRVQEKLLRVVEYGEYERIGGEKTLLANVRILGAANVDLRAKATAGEFRADLLDRLAFDVIAAPPLRDRREDIMLLAAHFAHAMALELDVVFPGFSPSATNMLLAHQWPGNVRELKNTAERAVFHWASIEAQGLIENIIIDPFAAAFGAHKPAPTVDKRPSARELSAQSASNVDADNAPEFDLRARLDLVEKELVEAALKRNAYNQRRTAKALSLSYDQIRGIIRKYDLSK